MAAEVLSAEVSGARDRRGSWAVAFVLVAVAAVGVGFREIGDWDAWWQLLIGRVAIDEATTLPTDTFSYSVTGTPWAHKDLAGYVLLEAGYRLGGFAGLSLVRSAVAVGVLVALLMTVRREQRRAWVWVAIGALLIGANEFRFIPRALIFSELGFIGLLALIERVREHIARSPNVVPWRWLGVIVLWMMLWTNLHRGALLGFVVLGGLVAALLLDRLLGAVGFIRSRGGSSVLGPGVDAGWRTIGAVAASALLAAAGGCLNASGVAVYTTGLAVSYDPIHRGFISEWHPVTLELATREFAPLSALVAAGWLAAVGAFGARLLSMMHRAAAQEAGAPPAAPPAIDLWHVGVLAVMTVQGLSSLRWLSFAAAAAAVVLIRSVSSWGAAGREVRVRPLLAVALAASLTLPLPLMRNGRAWGVGPVPDRYPEGALAFAREHGLGTDVHNAFIFGGYVAWAGWPDFRVLIDGRNDMVYPSEFYLRCIEAQSDAEKFAALQTDYPTSWVLAENTAGRESFGFLEGDPAWMAVYWSEPAVIWVRRAQYPVLAELEYRLLDVRDPVASMVAAAAASQAGDPVDAQLRRELQRFAESSVASIRALTMLAIYFDIRGDVARRDATFLELQRLAPDSPVTEQLREGFSR